MAETLKHSLRAYILRDLIRHGALYEDQLISELAPNQEGLFQIAIERLSDVKYISKVKGVSRTAYMFTQKGRDAYYQYLKEMIIT
jgi:hypothetical protein